MSHTVSHAGFLILARADQSALELTDDPQGLVCLQQRLGQANLSDPDPGWGWRVLHGTHPTKIERIGAAEQFAERGGLGELDAATCRGDGASTVASGQ